MKFPINFNRDTWLHNSGCDLCGKPMPTGDFVSFSFGEQQNNARDDTLNLAHVEIGVSLGWQSSTPNTGTGFQVVEETAHCQCNFSFCSTEGLRKFMNCMVDELESLIENEKSLPIDTSPPIRQQFRGAMAADVGCQRWLPHADENH